MCEASAVLCARRSWNTMAGCVLSCILKEFWTFAFVFLCLQISHFVVFLHFCICSALELRHDGWSWSLVKALMFCTFVFCTSIPLYICNSLIVIFAFLHVCIFAVRSCWCMMAISVFQSVVWYSIVVFGIFVFMYLCTFVFCSAQFRHYGKQRSLESNLKACWIWLFYICVFVCFCILQCSAVEPWWQAVFSRVRCVRRK